MDIDRVRYFHVFAETGSMVKASEILRISQPALSKAMRLLETETGLRLLEPHGRGLSLTINGKAFRKETAPLLEQWTSVAQRLKANAAKTPTRIGSFEVFTTYFLGVLAESLRVDALEIHELTPGKLEQAIVDGTVDLGITYLPIPVAETEFLEVAKVKMGVFGLKKFKDVEFSELPFVVPLFSGSGAPSKVAGLDGWPDHKHARSVRYRVSLMESALELCRRGLAVAYLPEFVVDLHSKSVRSEYQLVELECSLPKKDRTQSVFLMSRKGQLESSLARDVAKALRRLT